MSYDPIAIANHFLDIAKSKGETLDPMKLQKLIFFGHGWHLALEDSPLINEQVEAWAYGPVIPSVYRKFRHYGNQAITEKAEVGAMRRAPASSGYLYCLRTPNLVDSPNDADFTAKFLGRIWDVYGKYTGVQLSNLTHENNTPWSQVMAQYGGKPPKGTDIPGDLMRDYFRNLIPRPRAESER